MTQTGKQTRDPADRSTTLFDLRYLIGGLFTLYGVVLAVVGLFDSDAELDKAAGIRINLWVGLGMLVTGILFLTWARLRPLRHELGNGEADADRTP
jgi:xanthine/uracil/vitamin C permease (AzgA family)